ncbi:flavonoid 3'-monooxygenase CYP75B137-like isoform X2 [Rhodamnia argentea]|uniref:Flavonoid 3'-monooxygenase CYP75B137-like isoform X2 n=1 Tax=Rhodamnia argentea TaxID=178133 RepID=A0A8B8MNH8_9MYRT|nr:flavonoid 3'-monooxygenase CYP75B137-like isoform X2 [Rhodamnia argentea]
MSNGDSGGPWPWLWHAKEANDAIPGATITLLVIAITALIFFAWFRRQKDTTAPLPPGPRGLPFLGYLPFLGTDLHWKFAKLAESYGPIYKLQLGSKLYIVVNSPLLAKEIVRDQDVTFANRDPNIAAIIASYGARNIAFSSQGPYWRNLRKLFVRQIMSNASLDACYDLRRQEVRKGLSDLYRKSGVPVDIGEWALLILINAVMAMLWGGTLPGEKSEAMGAEFRKVLAKHMGLLGCPNVSDFFPSLAWLDLQGVERDMKRVHHWLDAFIQSVVECATQGRTNEPFGQKEGESKTNEQKKDFLQIVLETEMDLEDDQSPLDKNRALKAILMDIVIGGTDTTSTMVEWVMTELLLNRNVMNRVVHELTEVVGNDKMVEEHQLPKLKYLNAVIKEAFRLHPALPLLVPRTPDSTCAIGGYTIPKGSNIFLNMGYIHKDPKIWDKPSDFRPERFLEDPSEYDLSGNNFMYMPFGSGRRICAGLPLAERMLAYVLASLLHSFEWELPLGTELELLDKFGIVVKKMNPLVAIPRPRLSTPELYMS